MDIINNTANKLFIVIRRVNYSEGLSIFKINEKDSKDGNSLSVDESEYDMNTITIQ